MSRHNPTPECVSRAIAPHIPTVDVVQMRSKLLWLCERNEPFAHVQLEDNGIVVRISVHCAPTYAAVVVAALSRCAPVQVNKVPFIQRYDGSTVYGTDAHAYWASYQRKEPLLSATFNTSAKH